MSVLIELPFGFRGRVFRSPMPWGIYDRDGQAFDEFTGNQVSVVVLLAGDEECEGSAGRNLRELYRQRGLEVVYLPIPDYGVPSSPEAMKEAVRSVMRHAGEGRNVVVHCSAGKGRTGLFLACLAKDAFGVTAPEALAFVRKYIRGAVETGGQLRFLAEY